MQFTTLLAATLTLISAPTAVLGWAKDAKGVWVANNKVYARVGNFNNVHESCTRMNSQEVYTDKRMCAYWVNSNGEKRYGHCVNRSNKVECVPGCATYEVCNISMEDGSCEWGPAACLEKMGCGGRAGEADCLNFGCDAIC
ncbi:hypothetical protein C8A01DRAFT_41603 [Parachaetomium inaequale]|uniref:Uncharacterized protein n=1 Tax=Parachaetomium inaequale TaxID=2588326 RepID=A0AAN6P6Y3_9PEZI|nr:hypothetical protein C8A01DRAFT_41603 [Parachaetomium inaequale]